MSFNVRLVRTPNAAWEKPKSVFDEESLQKREEAYEEKLKQQIFNNESNADNLMKEEDEEEEDDAEDIDDYADDLQAPDI